ncbi:c-type cytochrome [Pseudoduganella sp. FT93W]|uniref:C-type cytochrome n=1 Tax=Duganella fentianensis TaxID=2692177 RepID=A0A845HVA1_9BURK|nr:c-type cytochrome [Duganella fentianensis]MYN44762.1 c-type cytochrome [Duganella fentianensis]
MAKANNTPRSGFSRLKLIGGLLLLAVTVAGAIYGPQLVGLIRFSHEFDKIAEESTRVGGKWPRASDACIACHGINGNARAQSYARLAGQPEAYIAKQLNAFASGERSNPVMTSLAVSMSPQEIAGLANHFSKMTPLPNDTLHVESVRIARGEALVKANNCASCHGAKFEGKDVYPRLAGQGYDYLREQLKRFKSGERHESSGAMAAIAAALSAQDVDDVSQFLASR